MTEPAGDKAARANAPARVVLVWDPLVRLIHWSVAAGVFLDALVLPGKSNAHLVIGFLVTGSVVVRLYWGLVGTSSARFKSFRPNPLAALRHLIGVRTGCRRVNLSHNPAGALMAYNLWAILIGMGATGNMMGLPTFSSWAWLRDLHQALFVWLMVSVALHLAGVLIDGKLTRVPLVRAMIDGKKRIPLGDDYE